MSQRSVLSASLKVAPPLSPFISVISHLLPSFSLTFLFVSSSSSLSLPAASLFHLSASLALHLTSLRRCLPGGGAAAPDLVVVGFQMVWLAERFRADPSAADPVLPQTPGGPGKGTRISRKTRGRGQGPGGPGGELRNRRTCHLMHLILKQSEGLLLSKFSHSRVV